MKFIHLILIILLVIPISNGFLDRDYYIINNVDYNSTNFTNYPSYSYLFANYYNISYIDSNLINFSYLENNHYNKSVINKTGHIGKVCPNNYIWKFNSTGQIECSPDSTGSTPNLEQVLSEGNSANGLDIRDVDNFNMTGIFRQGIDGSMFIYDTDDEIHHVNADLERFDELRANVFTNPLNIETFYNSTGQYINISTIDGNDITFILSNGTTANSERFNYNQTILKLFNGTNETPVLNKVYVQYSGGIPTWFVTLSDPVGSHAMLSRVLVGEINENPYASALQEDGSAGFVKRVQRTNRKRGLLYESGLDYNLSENEIVIGEANYINGIYDEFINNVMNSSEGFYLVESNGNYRWINSFSEIVNYSDGNSIGTNKNYNIVFGVTPYDGKGNIYAVVQSKPNVEYNTILEAYADNDNTLKVYPSEEFLKIFFLPAVRVIVNSQSNELQTLPNGLYGEDYRGGVAGGVSSGGGLTEADPVWSAEKVNYVPYTGATSDVDLGSYDLIADKGIFNATSTANALELNRDGGTNGYLDINFPSTYTNMDGRSDYVWNVLGSEKMRLKANGYLGVETSNPLNKLHITGSNFGVRLQNTASGSHTWELRPYRAGISNGGFSLYDITDSKELIAISDADDIILNSDTNVNGGTILSSSDSSKPLQVIGNSDNIGGANEFLTIQDLDDGVGSHTGYLAWKDHLGNLMGSIFANDGGTTDGLSLSGGSSISANDVLIDNSGDVYINNGNLYLPGTPASWGSATSRIIFGDGDSGFYEEIDDYIGVRTGGSTTMYFSPGQMYSPVSGSAIMHEVASSTNPVLIPTNADTDTGIGRAGANILSLIAGSVNVMNINTSGLDVNGDIYLDSNDKLIQGGYSQYYNSNQIFNITSGEYNFYNSTGWGTLNAHDFVTHTYNATQDNALESFGVEDYKIESEVVDLSRPVNMNKEIEICELKMYNATESKCYKQLVYEEQQVEICDYISYNDYYKYEYHNETKSLPKENCTEIEFCNYLPEFNNITNETIYYKECNLIKSCENVYEEVCEDIIVKKEKEICHNETIIETTYPYKIKINGTSQGQMLADVEETLIDLNNNIDLYDNVSDFNTIVLAEEYKFQSKSVNPDIDYTSVFSDAVPFLEKHKSKYTTNISLRDINISVDDVEEQIKDLQGYILQNEFCRLNNKKFDDYNACMNSGESLGVKIK